MSGLADKFFELFKGSTAAHGEYRVKKVEVTDQKVVGKAITYDGPPTLELWEKHLNGDIGLGVIPIMSTNMCWWGAIDIDIYDGFNHKELLQKIKKLKLPLTVCRTKSGGAHVFLFCQETIAAGTVKDYLRNCAAKLGHGGDTEIFPKQAEVLASRGDMGNWLNMPYQDNENTTVRFGFHPSTCKVLTAEEFIDVAMSRRVREPDLSEPVNVNEKKKSPFAQWFTCMQIINEMGGAESGERNMVATQLAIQLKRIWPTDWEEKYEKYLPHFISGDPLPAEEVMTIKKSVASKEYGPLCDKEPMCNYCDKGSCRSRKYGVGQFSSFAFMENLQKIPTDPPLWFVTIMVGDKSKRTEVTSEELLNQKKFRKKVLEVHNMYPTIMRDDQWAKMMQGLLEKCDVLHRNAGYGQSFDERFLELLEDFLTLRPTKVRADLLTGKVFLENGFYYFQMRVLTTYLERKRFFQFSLPQRAQRLRNVGGGSKQFKVAKGKNLNVWYVPEGIFDELRNKRGGLFEPEIQDDPYQNDSPPDDGGPPDSDLPEMGAEGVM